MTPKDWYRIICNATTEQMPTLLPYFADWLQDRGEDTEVDFRTNSSSYVCKGRTISCIEIQNLSFDAILVAMVDNNQQLPLTQFYVSGGSRYFGECQQYSDVTVTVSPELGPLDTTDTGTGYARMLLQAGFKVISVEVRFGWAYKWEQARKLLEQMMEYQN